MRKLLKLCISFLSSFFIFITPLYAATYPTAFNNLPVSYLSAFVDVGSPNTSFSDEFQLRGTAPASALYSSLEWFYKADASHNICSATIPVRVQGSPTDSITLDVYYAQDYTAAGSGPIDFDTHVVTGISGMSPLTATFMQSPVSDWQVTASTSPYQAITFQFSPCIVAVGGHGYWFKLSRTGTGSDTNYYKIGGYVDGTGDSYKFGSTENSDNWAITATFYDGTRSAPGSHTMWQLVLNGTENYSASSIPNGNATSTFDSIINSLTDANASSSVSSTLGSLVNWYPTIANRVPFAWLFDIGRIYRDAATSSAGFTPITVDFSDTRISTGTRSFLPSSITILSTTTVTTYLPPALLDPLNALASACLYIAFMIYLWYRIKSLIPAV